MVVFLLVTPRCVLWPRRVLYFLARRTSCCFLLVAERLPVHPLAHSRNGAAFLIFLWLHSLIVSTTRCEPFCRENATFGFRRTQCRALRALRGSMTLPSRICEPCKGKLEKRSHETRML